MSSPSSSSSGSSNFARPARHTPLGMLVRVGAVALGAAMQTPRASAHEGCEAEPVPAHIEIRHADRLGVIDKGWWKARYTASWVPQADAGYLAMGPLQLFSQDVIAPGGYFEPHPHDNLEIVTIVLEGQFEHQDDANPKAIVRAGDVMLMSAGSGLYHSERGHSDAVTRVMTIWLSPRTRDNAPFHRVASMGPETGDGEGGAPGWRSIAAERGALLTVDSDARIEMARIEENGVADYAVAPGRQVYAAVEGAVVVNGQMMSAPDRLMAGEGTLRFRATAPAMVVLVDMPLR